MKTHQLAITTLIAAAAFAGGFVNAPCSAAAPETTTATPASGAVYGKEETAGLKTIATAALTAATAGKKPEAVTKITELEKAWDRKEKAMKAKSAATWTELDKALDQAIEAIRSKGNLADGKTALEDFTKKLEQATKP